MNRESPQPAAAPPKGKWLWSAAMVTAAVLAIVFFYRPNPVPDGRVNGNYDGLLQQAAQLDRSGKFADEITLLKQAVSLQPNRWEAYDQEGQAYLYGLNELEPAEQAYQESLANSGSVTLHVMLDHGAGNFASYGSGLLSISKESVEFKPSDSQDYFKFTRAEILSAQIKSSLAFEIRIRNQDLVFAPLGQFAGAQRDLALKILSK